MDDLPATTEPLDDEPTWTEEIEITGGELVDRVKDLIAEGNVRRLILLNKEGDVLIELPLTPVVVVGGLVTLTSPQLAAIGAVAALIAKLKVQIVHVGEDE